MSPRLALLAPPPAAVFVVFAPVVPVVVVGLRGFASAISSSLPSGLSITGLCSCLACACSGVGFAEGGTDAEVEVEVEAEVDEEVVGRDMGMEGLVDPIGVEEEAELRNSGGEICFPSAL